MANVGKTTSVRKAQLSAIFPMFTLATWRIRHSWGLLLMTGLGVAVAIMLVCTTSLYSQVVMSAGLRTVLATNPQNTDISVTGLSARISTPLVNQVRQHLDQRFQQYFGADLQPVQFSFQAHSLPITATTPGLSSTDIFNPAVNKSQMILIGTATADASHHLVMTSGHLPSDASSGGGGTPSIEIVLPQESGVLLHAHLGTVLTIAVRFVDVSGLETFHAISLSVVGFFKLKSATDAYWDDNDLKAQTPNDFLTVYQSLTSNQALLAAFTQLSNEEAPHNKILGTQQNFVWDYRLDLAHLSINDLDAIENDVHNVETDNSNDAALDQSPLIQGVHTFLPATTLKQYQKLVSIAQLPIACLLLLLIGLVLLFISVMAGLLVENQASAIAILRSRGASGRQIFGALASQGIGVSLIAMVVGPFLAQPLTSLLVKYTISTDEQGALNIIDGNPVLLIWDLRWLILGMTGVAIIALCLSIVPTLRMDVLSIRRQSGRSAQSPLWQRLNLDILIAIIALAGFGTSLYMTNSGVLGLQSSLILLPPITVLGALCLILAALLLFLRILPVLLGSITNLSARGRGTLSLLALAQMVRVPRQSIRMILQLSLATAFAVFTLSCLSSQSQRILDVANYQTGADFSGNFPHGRLVTFSQLKATTALYNHIPGVISSSLGTVSTVTSGTAGGPVTNLDFNAVDADTFAQSALWTSQDSVQPLPLLMSQLVSQRSTAVEHKVVPAIVDSATWNALHLSPGGNFTLNFSLYSYNDKINFVAVAEVEHIPSSDSTIGAGVLVDYQSYVQVYQKTTSVSEFVIPLTTIWLHTRDDAASLQSVRSALTNQTDIFLDPLAFYDRRGIAVSLYHEPLYLTLAGILGLGSILTVLFALVSNLMTSWLSIQKRLTNFSVLRAIGAGPRQVLGVLAWEQCIIYTTALILGFVLGIIFAETVVPVLTFTSVVPSQVNTVADTTSFYLAQSIPPIQVVLPPSLGIVLLALIVLSLLALALMVLVALRASLNQTLKVNED